MQRRFDVGTYRSDLPTPLHFTEARKGNKASEV